jgi:hypothetical protein
MTVTAQDTYDHFIGSGALSYSWYQEVAIDGTGDAGDVTGNSWTLRFVETGDDGPGMSREVTHRGVMRAVRELASAKGSDVEHLSRSCRRECQALVFKGADEADFDAGTADEVIQYAALGEIVYG